MITKIRKTVFSNSNKSQAAPHIFLVLCAYTIITTIYTGLLFDAKAMVVRFILGLAVIAIHIIAERSPLSAEWTSFLSPLMIAATLIFGAVYFDGDGLLFFYLSCVALISVAYFAEKGLAAYIITVGVAIAAMLFIFGINLLGKDFTMIYNIISFMAAMGLNALAYSFCVFSINLLQKEESANKAKSEFLSAMSHEIRTPLNAILGVTEIQLQNERVDEDVREALGKIYSSGDLLLGIINDILDLSKIEAGKLELMSARYEIASLISDTAQLNMMRIGSKPIEFELDVDVDLPTLLMGDELRVKQILNNILSNAFKYTAEGTVKLSVRAEAAGPGRALKAGKAAFASGSAGASVQAERSGGDSGGDSGDSAGSGTATLVMSVSDTGQGMTPEQVDKLFDEYSRFNMEANRTTEGTGLGMSITRNLIRLMNGEIHIESEPGKGSTFTVRIPQMRVGAETLGAEMADNLHQFRTSSRAQMKRVQISRDPMPYGAVLIVDDVETNIYVAKGLMTPYELKIDSADSGYAAISKIENGNVYDIVFMDHMMPQMDGIEATKTIRDMGYKEPIVALTANAVAGQAEIFLGNGFDDFISKPIDVRQLNTVLNKLIRDKQPPEVIEKARRGAAAGGPGSGSAGDGSGARVGRPPEPGGVDPQFAEIFARDARKALAVLDEISDRNGYGNEADMRSYIINVHGMKSALANIKEMELSAAAMKLEAAGREGKLDIVESGTPGFLAALRGFVDGMAPPSADFDSGDAPDEDPELLREKLLAIKAACEEYDESAADGALSELNAKSWSRETKELLKAISENILHSDFDEIVNLIETHLAV